MADSTSGPIVHIDAVLFDAVGTLIELRESVGVTYARWARIHGVSLPEWRLEDAFRRVLPASPPMVFPNREPDSAAEAERSWWRDVVRSTLRAADSTLRFANFDAFFDDLFRHYGSREAWRLRPGAAEALPELRALELRLAIVSNFDHRLPNLLQDLEIDQFFDHVEIPVNSGICKPDRGIFDRALARLGTPAERAAYVGDDPERDLEASRAAGLQPIAVAELESLQALPARLRAIATLPGRQIAAPDPAGDPAA